MRIIDFADGFSSSSAPTSSSSITLPSGIGIGATGPSSGFTTELCSIYHAAAATASARHAGLASWTDSTGTTAVTTGLNAAVSGIFRRNPDGSVTDAGVFTAGFFNAQINAGFGTYTNTNGTCGVAGIYVDNIALTGTSAISYYAAIYVDSDSANTGTNKFGLRMGSISGATNNYSIYSTGGTMFHLGSVRVGIDALAAFGSEILTVYGGAAAGATSRAGFSSWLDVTTSTAHTVRAAASSGILRRIPSASVTDTNYLSGGFFQTYINAGAGTYTNTNSESGVSAIYVREMSPVGTMAITSYSGIFIAGDSTNTGTNKHGIKINNISGATNNYAIYTGAGSVRFGGVVQCVSGVRTIVSSANTANPPTDAELDSAFGEPATVGSGFMAILDDNAGDTNVYLVYSNGTSWFHAIGTKAA